jgi:hypothetical protein
MLTIDPKAWAWFMSGDTGTSSKTIWSVMTGIPIDCADVPYDPSDFGRCHRLLEKFPEWRERLGEVAARYPVWGPLVREWPALTRRYVRAIEQGRKSAPKMWHRMETLVDEGRLAAGWERVGLHGWRLPAQPATEQEGASS